ncbi:MAG: HyaD/HybD family hydrogenase maturation endopeptidase [Anaerolineales bacterium]
MFDRSAFKTLVLGVGNKLMSDEGVGVHVIERLAAGYVIPEEVQVLDGGVLGMDLLYYLEGIENLLLVDAVETHKEPGTIIRLEGEEEVPAFLAMKISPHQIGVPDMLAAARFKDLYPKQLVLWGIQPELLEIGLDLSPLIESKVDALVENMVEQLKAWGHNVTS